MLYFLFQIFQDFLYIARHFAAILFSIYAKLPIVGMSYLRMGPYSKIDVLIVYCKESISCKTHKKN